MTAVFLWCELTTRNKTPFKLTEPPLFSASVTTMMPAMSNMYDSRTNGVATRCPTDDARKLKPQSVHTRGSKYRLIKAFGFHAAFFVTSIPLLNMMMLPSRSVRQTFAPQSFRRDSASSCGWP